MQPLVSVIMSAYQHERYVGDAINSVLEQTLPDFEFLIADDGSKDGTADVIRGFSDRRIRAVFHKNNLGACVCLNRLLDKCRGKYIAVLNSDDMFEPDKLEKQLAFLFAHKNAAACFTRVKLIDKDGAPLESEDYYQLFDQFDRPRTAWLRRLFYGGNCLCHPTLLARREQFRLRFDERLCKLPDMDMWVRLLMRHDICLMPDRLTRFRLLDGENMSGPRADTLSLVDLETPLVLEHFAHLSREDCAAVFGITGSAGVRSYAACTAALDGTPPMRAWGFAGLYKLLGEPRSRRALKRLGFDERSLFELGASTDVYNSLPLRAKLYYAPGGALKQGCALDSAFCETRCASLPVSRAKEFSHTFKLNARARYLRFDPCDQPCRVRLASAEALLESGDSITLENGVNNGADNCGALEFRHFDAAIIYILSETCDVKSVQIQGTWEFIQPSEICPAPPGINWTQQHDVC